MIDRMRARRRPIALVASLATLALLAGLPAAARSASPSADAVGAVIEAHRAAIPSLMEEEGIPGLALALVDRDGVLWLEGFGRRGRHDPAPVTPDTAFSVQSLSKLFTATTVMVSAEDGRVDLDAPITRYLPDFTVHSAFEDHPERRITLRMLLSHTAGFTHEAPVGNNFDLAPGTWEEHVRSISDTWLRFPAGSGYAYSNLGIDLAAAILERVYGEAYPVIAQRLVLEPLGMSRSTFDRATIMATADRAQGSYELLSRPPVVVPMMASGGLDSTARDLARFLRFQLGDGALDGRRVLDPARVAEMRTIPPPEAGSSAGYGLGVAITRWRAADNTLLYSHGGGGFGYLSDFWFAPELGLGIAVLTNAGDHAIQGQLALSILGDVAHAPGSPYEQRLRALPQRPSPVEPSSNFRPPAHLSELVAAAGRTPAPDDALRWAADVGSYAEATWGVVFPDGLSDRFTVTDGRPTFETMDEGRRVTHRLTELDAGRFLADDGELLDLAAPVPTWRNIELVRVGEQPTAGQWALVGVAAVAGASWLIALVVRGVRAGRARRREGRLRGARTTRWAIAATLVATLAAVLVLVETALLVVSPGMADSGFLGWLEFPIGLELVWHVPVALLGVTLAAAVAVLLAHARGWWTRSSRIHATGLVVAAAVLVGQLVAWRLVGWDFG